MKLTQPQKLIDSLNNKVDKPIKSCIVFPGKNLSKEAELKIATNVVYKKRGYHVVLDNDRIQVFFGAKLITWFCLGDPKKATGRGQRTFDWSNKLHRAACKAAREAHEQLVEEKGLLAFSDIDWPDNQEEYDLWNA